MLCARQATVSNEEKVGEVREVQWHRRVGGAEGEYRETIEEEEDKAKKMGMNKEEGYKEEKEEVQSPSSKSYLWDVFLYLRLPEKTNTKTVRDRLKC